ncbi:pyridoxal phosphate-dependent aminotransferase [Shewanella sp. 125m-1]
MFLNKNVKRLSPYKVSSHKAWESIENENILKLDWNESTIPPSPKVAEAINYFLLNGKLNWYPDVANAKLKQKLAEYVGLPECNVESFSSSDGLHEYVLRSFVSSEDIIVLVSPTYDNFRAVAESVGATINYFYLDYENNFKFDVEKFKEHLESVSPKAVYLCNPNNPTGNVYDVGIIKELVKEFNDVLFILDEAYYEFSGITASNLVLDFENVLICRTFSKAFGLASIRFGYAISSEKNIQGLHRIRNAKSVNSFAQLSAIAALDDVEYMRSYVDDVNSSKSSFIKSLVERDFKVLNSEGGNFVLLDLGDSAEFYVKELEVLLIYVRSFGHLNACKGLVRITIGIESQMKVVLDALDAISKKL